MVKINNLDRSLKVINPKDIQRIGKDILKDFDAVCRKNNLRYSIAYGTLLGAVRHQGFIPWDDDIDVIMPRSDYEKFEDFFCKELSKNHRFVSIGTDREFMAPLAKIIDTNTLLIEEGHSVKMEIGVYIDIFVYDGIPEQENVQNRIFKRANHLQRVWSFGECYSKENTPILLRPIRKMCNRTKIARVVSKLMEYHAKRYKFEDCIFMGNNMFGEYRDRRKYVFESDEFNFISEYTFDELNVLGFKNYDLFLKKWYGDYMKFPPKEEQVSNHNFQAWWIKRDN